MTWFVMRRWVSILAAATAMSVSAPAAGARQPEQPRAREAISLHPENPHYFLWRGRPTILITSAEHYGAVMNLDFDFRRYLNTLAAEGMNYTRLMSGAYVEPEGAFKITRNTLAPRPRRYLAPWARSNQPGYANGGNKFDLSKWDEAYFKRLKTFVADGASKNIVVELSLFCPMYEDMQWALSPMNTVNNVNGVGAIGRNDVYTLDRNGPLLAAQVALVRKIVTELNEFDNVIYEISNEPYFGGVTMAWQHHIADTIVETERTLPSKHLISQNIANKSAKIADPHPSVSIFNFHYATPPDAVATNYALNKVIGDDETGFRGVDDAFYRSEAWEFVLAGGGLYNNLDYSFTVGHENGTFAYPSTQPGGGSRALRRQLKVLRDFMDSFDFVRMSPDDSVIKAGVPDGGAARALVDPGKAIAIYVRKPLPPAKPASTPTSLEIQLADGVWSAEWVTMIGSVVRGAQTARRWHTHARVSAVRARYRAASEARVAAPVVFPNEPCHTVAHLGYQMSKPQPESKVDVWQGTLALMVLKTLEVMGPLHGFGLARRIEQTSGDRLALNPGTLYPMLLKLEQEGSIESEWGASENNRRARFYRLTRAGRKQLEKEAQDWESATDIMARFLAPKASR